MKRPRPLIATLLALGGLAAWAAWHAESVHSGAWPAALFQSDEQASSQPQHQFMPVAAHEASLGADGDAPADWLPAGPELVSGLSTPPQPAGATPDNILALAPQGSAPGEPARSNNSDEGQLPFSVVDMPGEQASSAGLVRLPPLPEPPRDSDSGVQRLPPVPEGLSAMPAPSAVADIQYPTTGSPRAESPTRGSPATTGSPMTASPMNRGSSGDASRIDHATTQEGAAPRGEMPQRPIWAPIAPPTAPAAVAPAPAKPVTSLPPQSATWTPAAADPLPFLHAGPAFETSRPEPTRDVSTPAAAPSAPVAAAAVNAPRAATPTTFPTVSSAPAAKASPAPQTQPAEDNPFASSPGADLRPLSELLGPANGQVVQREPGPAWPKTEDPFAARAMAPSSSLPLTGPTGPSLTASSGGPSAPTKQPWPTTSAPSMETTGRSGSPLLGAATPSGPPATRGPAGAGAVFPWGAAPRTSPLASSASALPASPPTTTPKQEVPLRSALASPASSVPTASPAPVEQRAMYAVLCKAEAHFQRGVALADRRAFYSARAEFLAALRLIAQGLDAQEGGMTRSESLARGVWALDEANDFIPRAAALNTDVPVARLVAAHRTTILKPAVSKTPGACVTPLQAVQQYYTYGQEQLAAAVRPSPQGSQALTALGKLYVEMELEPAHLVADAKTKGLVCQQAALLVNPNNARAANELGVLLAREGRYEEARDWLRHSLRVKPQQETWHNLATVHTSLGESKLAEAAQQQSIAMARRQGQTAGDAPVAQVKQVSPTEFARSSQPGTSATAATAATTSPTAPQAAAKPKSGGMWDWLPWR